MRKKADFGHHLHQHSFRSLNVVMSEPVSGSHTTTCAASIYLLVIRWFIAKSPEPNTPSVGKLLRMGLSAVNSTFETLPRNFREVREALLARSDCFCQSRDGRMSKKRKQRNDWSRETGYCMRTVYVAQWWTRSRSGKFTLHSWLTDWQVSSSTVLHGVLRLLPIDHQYHSSGEEIACGVCRFTPCIGSFLWQAFLSSLSVAAVRLNAAKHFRPVIVRRKVAHNQWTSEAKRWLVPFLGGDEIRTDGVNRWAFSTIRGRKKNVPVKWSLLFWTCSLPVSDDNISLWVRLFVWLLVKGQKDRILTKSCFFSNGLCQPSKHNYFISLLYNLNMLLTVCIY